MVPSMTRRPAKPMRTFGSARMMSPKEAKEAVTPPVVGSVRTAEIGLPVFLQIPALDLADDCNGDAAEFADAA